MTEGVTLCRTACAAALLGIAAFPARADPGMDMTAGSMQEPIFAHVLLNQLEERLGGGSAFRWDAEGWAGGDQNRLWLKTEGFATAAGTQDGDQELLYARPIAPYFDLQAGLRYDLDSRPGRAWGAIGVEGLLPLFVKLSATAYASDAGHYAAKLVASYELLLTQRVVLEPQVELNFYSRAQPERQLGTGLADMDAGLRLRYEVSRKFGPYLGITYHRGSPQSGAAPVLPPARLQLAVGVWLWQ